MLINFFGYDIINLSKIFRMRIVMREPISVKIKRILCLLAVTVLLCSCGAGENIQEETASATESTTENMEYLLVRAWTGKELLNSIFYCGEFHPLPLIPEENEGFSLSGEILTFSDGSYAAAQTDENGSVISLFFERGSAPDDFSVYGIDFSSSPDDISGKVGIANNVYGNKDETISYIFTDGGIGELTFVYTDRTLVSVYISVEA